MTGIELKLISKTDKHLLIDKITGEGISYIAKRYSKANNKYMKCYGSSEESKLFDSNTLYGFPTSQYLP